MSDRIQAIRKMLQREPTDVFLHYSLGMEYASAKRYDQAVAAFKRCIELDDAYVPAYVEAGKCLRAAGKLAAAREIFSAGLRVAEAQKQQHTRDFIRQQLESLGPAGG